MGGHFSHCFTLFVLQCDLLSFLMLTSNQISLCSFTSSRSQVNTFALLTWPGSEGCESKDFHTFSKTPKSDGHKGMKDVGLVTHCSRLEKS